MDKVLKRSKRSVKKIREENKNLKNENKNLLKENKELKSKIDELILENKAKTDNINEDNFKKKIEALEDEIKSLKDDNTKLSIYKKMYEPEVNKEFDILWGI